MKICLNKNIEKTCIMSKYKRCVQNISEYLFGNTAGTLES